LAACGTRATDRGSAAHWRAHAVRHGRFGSAGAIRGIPGKAAAIGLDRCRNVHVDARWSAGNASDTRKYAEELVALAPDVIFASASPGLGSALQTTRTIPIVFATVTDPVGAGYVQSLSQPGGNLTGFTPIENSLGGKWVELLKEIAPRVARVAMVFDRAMAPFASYYLNPFKAAAASFGMEAIVAPVDDMAELERVVADLD
jgi:putative tryptophan/tyrosine transport system substrate-binding protein